MTRLESIAAELVSELREWPEERQRASCLSACEFAVKRSGIDNSLVREILAILQCAVVPSAKKRQELVELTDSLDDEYFKLQMISEESAAVEADFMSLFKQARAVAALYFASSPDSFEAAVEAIYEASATTDNPGELLSIIQVSNK